VAESRYGNAILVSLTRRKRPMPSPRTMTVEEALSHPDCKQIWNKKMKKDPHTLDGNIKEVDLDKPTDIDA
jgi:hypothetical protein